MSTAPEVAAGPDGPPAPGLRVAYIAAGAAGMYCGSCLHDNALASALGRLGHEAILIPTYTPLRTDEASVSQSRVFYGAINVYLQLKVPLFRHTPAALDWLLDRQRLLRWVSRFAGTTNAHELGALTLAVLQGEAGPQHKELDKLVAWLRGVEPDVVHVTNSLFLGMVRRLRQDLGVPVVVALQGEDLFIDDLPERHRRRVLDEMRARAGEVDLFLAPSHYYADLMARRLEVPRDRIQVVPLGITLDGYGEGPRPEGPPTVGFLARICPEKGLHRLVEAFRRLAPEPGMEELRLAVAGYLGPRDQPYFAELQRQVEAWGLGGRVDWIGEVDRERKLELLASWDVLALPTVYREAKGLSALEAMASATPVVVPAHGSFPEMIESTGGGVLFEPDSLDGLVAALRRLLADPARGRELGSEGRRNVQARFGAAAMARSTVQAYRRAQGSVEGQMAAGS